MNFAEAKKEACKVHDPYVIEDRLRTLISDERKATSEILKLINIAFDQKTYLELGYPNMFEWLTKGFGYSNASAYRRIEAARLLRAVPEVSKKLEEGVVNLSTISKAQSAFRLHEKSFLKAEAEMATGDRVQDQMQNDAHRGQKLKLDSAQKLKVIESIENKSLEEAERILINQFPEMSCQMSRPQRKVLDSNTMRLSVNLPNESVDLLDRAKEVLSHIVPDGDEAQVIAYALKFLLDKKDPLRKEAKASKIKSNVKKVTSASEVTQNKKNLNPAVKDIEGGCSGNLAASTRNRILKSSPCCEFKDPRTGRICGSRFQVQVDHIQPRSLGGLNEDRNLRTLCRQHNLLMAEKALGRGVVDRYRTRERNE